MISVARVISPAAVISIPSEWVISAVRMKYYDEIDVYNT